MPEPGSIGKKPQGSMVNTTELVSDIRKKKELDAIQQMQDHGEQDRADAEEQQQDDQINKLLPKEVGTAVGLVDYAKFRELYADVFEAVKNKDHWALGYVSHEFKLYDGLPVQVRTMRKREADVLRGTVPSGDVETFNDQQSEYETMRLLICLQKFGANVYQDDTKLSLKSVEEWRGSKAVEARADQLEDLPDEIVAFLGAVINDTMNAYRYAMTENLKNQLAPLSDTTDSA